MDPHKKLKILNVFCHFKVLTHFHFGSLTNNFFTFTPQLLIWLQLRPIMNSSVYNKKWHLAPHGAIPKPNPHRPKPKIQTTTNLTQPLFLSTKYPIRWYLIHIFLLFSTVTYRSPPLQIAINTNTIETHPRPHPRNVREC